MHVYIYIDTCIFTSMYTYIHVDPFGESTGNMIESLRLKLSNSKMTGVNGLVYRICSWKHKWLPRKRLISQSNRDIL